MKLFLTAIMALSAFAADAPQMDDPEPEVVLQKDNPKPEDTIQMDEAIADGALPKPGPGYHTYDGGLTTLGPTVGTDGQITQVVKSILWTVLETTSTETVTTAVPASIVTQNVTAIYDAPISTVFEDYTTTKTMTSTSSTSMPKPPPPGWKAPEGKPFRYACDWSFNMFKGADFWVKGNRAWMDDRLGYPVDEPQFKGVPEEIKEILSGCQLNKGTKFRDFREGPDKDGMEWSLEGNYNGARDCLEGALSRLGIDNAKCHNKIEWSRRCRPGAGPCKPF